MRDAEGDKPVSRDESFEYANEILVSSVNWIFLFVQNIVFKNVFNFLTEHN